MHIQQPPAPLQALGSKGKPPPPPGQGTARTHHRKRLEKYHKMKKKEQKAQQERRDHEASPQEMAANAPEEVEGTGPVSVKAGSPGFVPAQLYTMSHHLLVLRSTYAAMEFQPPIPRGYEDGWLQTVAVGLGRALGFSEPPVPMARKDPEEEHLTYRNWRLETSSAVLEPGVSNNQKWGPPHFWMKGRDWIIRQAVKHFTPKTLAEVLQKDEERRQLITTPRARLSQPAQRPEYVEAPPPYEEVMGTKRPSGEPKSAPDIDEWLSWGKGASLRVGKGRGHVESHPQKGGKGKQGDPATPRVGKGQANQAHSTNTNQDWHGCPRRLCPHRRIRREDSHCKIKDKKEPFTMAREADGAAEG